MDVKVIALREACQRMFNSPKDPEAIKGFKKALGDVSEKDIEPLQYGVDAYIVKKYILGIKDAELAIPDDLNLKGLELEILKGALEDSIALILDSEISQIKAMDILRTNLSMLFSFFILLQQHPPEVMKKPIIQYRLHELLALLKNFDNDKLSYDIILKVKALLSAPQYITTDPIVTQLESSLGEQVSVDMYEQFDEILASIAMISMYQTFTKGMTPGEASLANLHLEVLNKLLLAASKKPQLTLMQIKLYFVLALVSKSQQAKFSETYKKGNESFKKAIATAFQTSGAKLPSELQLLFKVANLTDKLPVNTEPVKEEYVDTLKLLTTIHGKQDSRTDLYFGVNVLVLLQQACAQIFGTTDIKTGHQLYPYKDMVDYLLNQTNKDIQQIYPAIRKNPDAYYRNLARRILATNQKELPYLLPELFTAISSAAAYEPYTLMSSNHHLSTIQIMVAVLEGLETNKKIRPTDVQIFRKHFQVAAVLSGINPEDEMLGTNVKAIVPTIFRLILNPTSKITKNETNTIIAIDKQYGLHPVIQTALLNAYKQKQLDSDLELFVPQWQVTIEMLKSNEKRSQTESVNTSLSNLMYDTLTHTFDEETLWRCLKDLGLYISSLILFELKVNPLLLTTIVNMANFLTGLSRMIKFPELETSIPNEIKTIYANSDYLANLRVIQLHASYAGSIGCTEEHCKRAMTDQQNVFLALFRLWTKNQAVKDAALKELKVLFGEKAVKQYYYGNPLIQHALSVVAKKHTDVIDIFNTGTFVESLIKPKYAEKTFAVKSEGIINELLLAESPATYEGAINRLLILFGDNQIEPNVDTATMVMHIVGDALVLVHNALLPLVRIVQHQRPIPKNDHDRLFKEAIAKLQIKFKEINDNLAAKKSLSASSLIVAISTALAERNSRPDKTLIDPMTTIKDLALQINTKLNANGEPNELNQALICAAGVKNVFNINSKPDSTAAANLASIKDLCASVQV